MELLHFSSGNSFASGVLKYDYRPATPQDTTNRIIIPIEIENGAQIEAVLDTGAPYAILDRYMAILAGYDPKLVLEKDFEMNIRGCKMLGTISRLNFVLRADVGKDMCVQTSVFVPDNTAFWNYYNFPLFVGQIGFLERIRFAIDPTEDKFYFGGL
jgi:hypothetical protein